MTCHGFPLRTCVGAGRCAIGVVAPYSCTWERPGGAHACKLTHCLAPRRPIKAQAMRLASWAPVLGGCGDAPAEVLEILDDGRGGMARMRWDPARGEAVREPVPGVG